MDHAARIERLESQMLEVLQEQARGGESRKQLKESVDTLSDNVTSLTATIERGRGAMWVLGGVGTAVGALGTFLGSKFLGS